MSHIVLGYTFMNFEIVIIIVNHVKKIPIHIDIILEFLWYTDLLLTLPLPSTTQHPSYGDCLEVKRKYYQNCSVLDCVTQCSQSAAHLYEPFLRVKQIGFVTLGPLRCA